MFDQERLAAMRAFVQEHQRASLAQLQARFQVSPATIRRDLTALEAQGAVVRVHGGVLAPGALQGEAPLERKAMLRLDEKRAIAEASDPWLDEAGAVFVDSGTTCLEVARRAIWRDGLTLFTNSVPILSLRGRARVVALGGTVRGVSGAMVGPVAVTALERLRVDVAFVGASGLHGGEGASTTEPDEAAIKGLFLQRAGTAVLVADSSKWDRPAPVQFGAWPAFQVWITDAEAPAQARRRVARWGPRVVVAARPKPNRS